jgi:prepilin-type processing-associated H-X9-DG protein
VSEILSPRTSRDALASFLLGLASPLVTGIPALALGIRGLRRINASEGLLRGRRLAVAGIFLGAFGTAFFALWIGWLVFSKLWAVSNRVTCLNNLRRIGLAVNEYDFVHQTFPPGTLPAPGLAPGQRLSWLAGLLPFLDMETKPTKRPNLKWQTLAEKIDPTQPWDSPANRDAAAKRLTVFLCPGHVRDEDLSPWGPTHYVGLAGIGRDAAELPKSDPRAGFFGYDRILRAKDVTAGTSTTFMATETARDNGPWAKGGPSTVRGLDPDETPYVGPGAPFGGLHLGGLNVLMADGSVRFVGDNVKPELFRDQLTINRRPEWVVPVFVASTVGFLGSPLGQGPLLAVSALIPERTPE